MNIDVIFYNFIWLSGLNVEIDSTLDIVSWVHWLGDIE
tara:strand:- start:159 stop:272 length:114 start_codon:yes stop_codon:yes gene_type:complete